MRYVVLPHAVLGDWANLRTLAMTRICSRQPVKDGAYALTSSAISIPLAPFSFRLQTLSTGEVAVCVWVLRLVPIVPALLLCACMRDPYVIERPRRVRSGNWQIERQTDRVTGKPISSAFIVTRTSSNAGRLYPQTASLQLSCFIDQPVIKFSFESKIGTDRNSFLGYRFDEKPGHEIGARFVKGASAVVIEDKAEVAQFVSELATSKVLYVRIRSLNAGRTAAEFKVEGAPGCDRCRVRRLSGDGTRAATRRHATDAPTQPLSGRAAIPPYGD